MDKSDSHRRKKFKVPKPDSNVSTSHKWTIFVIFLSFVLSLVFSLITSVAMQSLNLFFAFIVLFAIIAINILFDMIGTAVQSAEEKPFHSLAARKVKGARESISVIRHAPQLANLCCDVICDIAGIISGATTTLIVSELVAKFNLSGAFSVVLPVAKPLYERRMSFRYDLIKNHFWRHVRQKWLKI